MSEALEIARSLGMAVSYVRRHGEFSVCAPGKRPLKVSAHRKDASKILLVYLRQNGWR